MEDISLSKIDLNKLGDLSLEELNSLKIRIINNYELLNIPSVLLPDVFYDDYFFVSYSHKDYRLVYTDIINLQYHKLNTWYDRGIPGGKSWKDIANKYMSPINCAGVLFYISENALLSQAVIDEIEYALKLHKTIICINLPFENDYEYKGESTLGKVYSTKEMLEILKEHFDIDDKKIKIINAILNEEKLFLPYDMHIITKVEKIKGSVKEMPTLRYEINEHNCLEIKGANDINVLKLTKDDFPSLTDNVNNVFISSCAFANMIYLESVDLSNYRVIRDVGPYAFSSCLMLKDIINPSAIESLNDGAFSGCSSLEHLTLNNLHLLENYVFSDCLNLKSISLGDGCYYIGERCFANCPSLSEIKLPKNIEAIYSSAFEGCKSLKHIDLPKSLDELGSSAFSRSGLVSVSVPRNIKIIESYMFEKCLSLESANLPDSLTSIKEHAFAECINLKSISIPKGVKYLSDHLFDGCAKLTEVILASSIKQIGSSVFKNCISLISIKLPNKISSFGDNTFSGCISLENINIPSSLAIIPEGLFYGCNNLKEIELPINLKTIKSHAFCKSGLERIIYKGFITDFKQIELEKKCFFNDKDITVICLDGEIRLEK